MTCFVVIQIVRKIRLNAQRTFLQVSKNAATVGGTSAKLRTGDSGVHQKAVAFETEKELASVSAKVAANKGAMIESLLKSVTTVAN